MALGHAITEKAKTMDGVRQWPYKAISRALEVIKLFNNLTIIVGYPSYVDTKLWW